jgi:glycosyltransferase involved in cell wall biosynthesis
MRGERHDRIGSIAAVISVVLPSRNEPMVCDTARWMLAAGADEVIIVDDCSSPPVEVPADLLDKVVLVRNLEPRAPAYCRNLGGQTATGDIIVYSDAHVKPSEGGIVRLALLAQESNTVVGAGCKPCGNRNPAGVYTKIAGLSCTSPDTIEMELYTI